MLLVLRFKRILKKNLFELISRVIAFNRSLKFDQSTPNLHLVTTPKELIEIFVLRSRIYTKLNYNSEFPDIIEGLNFDTFDENAAILYTKKEGVITGTCRLIFDSDKKLPIDKNYSLDYLRATKKRLAEVSRLVIEHQSSGLNLEFKLLTKGVYFVIKQNGLDASISVIKDDHFKLYNRFGGFYIEERLHTYGHLDNTFVITSWNVLKISNFFKKLFLEEPKSA
jgi:predicted GNAT family N-acyltransferase